MENRFTIADAATILFVYLKLTEQIDWSWWLVLLPFILKSIVTTFKLYVVGKARQEADKNYPPRYR